MNKELFKLGINDFLKGLIVAVVMALMQTAYQVISVDGFDLTGLDIKEILIAGILAALAYLTKNLASNEKGEILKK